MKVNKVVCKESYEVHLESDEYELIQKTLDIFYYERNEEHKEKELALKLIKKMGESK